MLALVFLVSFSFSTWAQDFMPKQFKIDFEQSFVSKITRKEKRSLGELSYLYPSQIRFEIKGDNASIYISNGKKSWLYTPPFLKGEAGEVIESEKGQIHLAKILDLLQRGLKSSQYFDVIEKDFESTLKFKSPYDNEFKISSLILSHEKAKRMTKFLELSKMKIVYLDKKEVDLKLISLSEKADLSAKDFVFIAPENTKKISN